MKNLSLRQNIPSAGRNSSVGNIFENYLIAYTFAIGNLRTITQPGSAHVWGRGVASLNLFHPTKIKKGIICLVFARSFLFLNHQLPVYFIPAIPAATTAFSISKELKNMISKISYFHNCFTSNFCK